MPDFSRRRIRRLAEFIAAIWLTLGLGMGVSAQTRASDTRVLSWWQYQAALRLSQRWNLQLEGQIRGEDFVRVRQQALFRTGANFQATPHVTLTGGYAYFTTWSVGGPPAARRVEHRLWEQIGVRHKIGWATLDHRFRLENRLSRNQDPVSRETVAGFTYQNRARYRALLTIPLGGRARATGKTTPGDFLLNVGDEVLFNFGRTVTRNVFDRNRFIVSVGYQASPRTQFQVGYLYDRLQRANGVYDNVHILTFSVFQSFDARRWLGTRRP